MGIEVMSESIHPMTASHRMNKKDTDGLHFQSGVHLLSINPFNP